MKKSKLFVTVLAGLLVFGPVMTTTAAEPVSGEAVAAATGSTTQYDGDKAKYQTLIDAMIAAIENDAFGKPAYTWTLPELTDFVNKKIPKMKKEEEEHDVFWKDGEAPSKEKVVTYTGTKEDARGKISHSDLTYDDGSWNSFDSALYAVYNGSEVVHSISATDSVHSSGYISSFITHVDDKALEKLSTLDKALSMIDDADVVSYMKKEREVGNKREYHFSDGTSLIFTPNSNTGDYNETPSDSVSTTIYYAFRNHGIELYYFNGAFHNLWFFTSFIPTDMYRLYNPNSGEHFYTADRTEADNLVTAGWNDEGLGWKAPKMSDTPVYRLYNPNSGDHHYTPDEGEKNNLISLGWNDEGIGWYSFERKTTKLFRLYNPNEKTGTHHYTTDEGERDSLVKQGWVDEGIGWYGM